MFHSQIMPRRNQSVAGNRHNNSQMIIARRAVSPLPFREVMRRRSPSPERFNPSQTIHIKPRVVSMVGDGRVLDRRQHEPVRIIAQPQPIQTIQPIQRVYVQQQPKPIVIYVREQCPLKHVEETPSMPRSTTPINNIPPFTPAKMMPIRQSREESAAFILNTDSMNEGTHKQPSFAIDDEVEFELSDHYKSNNTIENVSTNNNDTNQYGSRTNPLEECISSLEHRVESMLKRDKVNNRSRFLRQIVHQGAQLKYK